MNDDHVDDSLLIARAFATPDAEAAKMVALDGQAGHWIYTVSGIEHELAVPWSAPITERPEIRREIVVLYNLACEKLGVEPRPQ